MILYYVAPLGLAAVVFLAVFRRITIFEYERGVRYRRGRAAGTLGPGVHWILPFTTTVTGAEKSTTSGDNSSVNAATPRV